MSRKQILIALGVVVLIALGVGAYSVFSPTDTGSAASAAAGPGYTLTPHDRTLGNPKAKVVLIEYAAPSCPVCARFNADTFPLVKQNYIDTGKVFYVFRMFPLRPDDGAAEKIARCLPEDKYFSFIDLLFRNQPKWDVEYGVLDVHGGLVLLGRIAGMSADQVDKCIANTSEDTIINQVASDGEAKYSLNSTPTLIVDGAVQTPGFIPYDDLKKTLDNELARKK